MRQAVVWQAEWLRARRVLFGKEKVFTKACDQPSAARRALPWVKVQIELCVQCPGR